MLLVKLLPLPVLQLPCCDQVSECSWQLLAPLREESDQHCCHKLELQLDKLLHFSICTLIVIVVYTLSSNCTKHPLANWRLPLAAAASLAAGALKEIGDYLHWWPGAVDLADLVSQVRRAAALAASYPLACFAATWFSSSLQLVSDVHRSWRR